MFFALPFTYLSNSTPQANDTQFGQYGVYTLNIDTCKIKTEQEPSNPYLPILWAAIILISLQLFWSLAKAARKNPRVRQTIRRLLIRSNSQGSGLISEDSNDTTNATK